MYSLYEPAFYTTNSVNNPYIPKVMDHKKMDRIANTLIGLGILLLLASYSLPAAKGFIFPETILLGWEAMLLTFAAFLEFFDDGTGAIAVGLFLSHLVLFAGIVLFLVKKAPGWYKTFLAVSAVYVLVISIAFMGITQLEIGFYTYLGSFALVWTALFLSPLKDKKMSVHPESEI